MKNLLTLKGSLKDCAYELGIREREDFKEVRQKLIQIVYGSELNRSLHSLLIKPTGTDMGDLYSQFISAYAEGLGVKKQVFLETIYLYSRSAHYAQIYPNLKALIPGCLTLIRRKHHDIEQLRVIDYSASAHGGESFQQIHWDTPETKSLLTISIKGLAPLFLFGLHHGGFSFSLQHKISPHFLATGKDIFEINFSNLIESVDLTDYRKNLKKYQSQSKWGIILVDHQGEGCHMDISGPSIDTETFFISDHEVRIITNRPILAETEHSPQLLYCLQREKSLKTAVENSSDHLLILLSKSSHHQPSSLTASSFGQFVLHLNSGHLDYRHTKGLPTANDAIYSQNLANVDEYSIKFPQGTYSENEMGLKLISDAQAKFDLGDHESAYHLLQIGLTNLKESKISYEILLCAWELKYLLNKNELNEIYQKLRLISATTELEIELKKKVLVLFQERLNLEGEGSKKVSTMVECKLIYPRIDCMDIFVPKII